MADFMNAHLLDYSGELLGRHITLVITPWKIYGFAGVALFAGRWFVQLYASRKAGRPVMTRTFWLMSMSGSLILLSYFIFSPKQDAVGVLSNLLPAFVASYNLYLDVRYHRNNGYRSAAAAELPGLAAQAPAAAPVEARCGSPGDPTGPREPLGVQPRPATAECREQVTAGNA